MRLTLFMPAMVLTLPLVVHAIGNYGGRGGYGRYGFSGRHRDDRHEVRVHRQLGEKDRVSRDRHDDILEGAGMGRAVSLSAHSPAVCLAMSSRRAIPRHSERSWGPVAARLRDGRSFDEMFVVNSPRSLDFGHAQSSISLRAPRVASLRERGLAIHRYRAWRT